MLSDGLALPDVYKLTDSGVTFAWDSTGFRGSRPAAGSAAVCAPKFEVEWGPEDACLTELHLYGNQMCLR